MSCHSIQVIILSVHFNILFVILGGKQNPLISSEAKKFPHYLSEEISTIY